jgi:prepilin-type processing-associated H-X9-DG protein
MRIVGRFFDERRVYVEPIDLAPQVVGLEMPVGFRRDPRIAVTEDSLHGTWVHARHHDCANGLFLDGHVESLTLEELKSKNLWIVGVDERAPQNYDLLDYKMDCAIVLGAEGKGVHELVRKKCDFLVSIPMLGKVPSLNVSVAAGVVLYEIVRQRQNKATADSK